MPTTALEIPKKAVADFCRRWNISELALFGSVLAWPNWMAMSGAPGGAS